MAKDDNNNFNIVITFCVVLAALWGLWHFFEGPILSMIRWIRLGELRVVGLLTDRFDPAIRVLPHMTTQPHGQKLSDQDLDAATMWNISAALGDIMRWPVTLVLVACAAWVWKHSPTTKFKNTYDLEGMIRMQSRTWPAITPVVNFDPGKGSARVPGTAVPERLPLFAESLSPDEWVAWCRIPVHADGQVDRDGIRQALVGQLGPRWEGLTGLRVHHRALLATFALKGAQKRKESDDLLGAIAQCWTAPKNGREGGLALTEEVKKRVDDVLRDRKLLAPILEQAGKHAFRVPALLGALRWAREQGGVLAPAQFLWLRGHDRALWYPLNNLGRRTYHAEGAGAMAHFMAEYAAKRPLPMPRVETAIQPVIDYMTTVGGRVPQLVS